MRAEDFGCAALFANFNRTTFFIHVWMLTDV